MWDPDDQVKRKAQEKGGHERTYSVHTAMNQYQKLRSIGTRSTITILGLNGTKYVNRELETSSDEDGRGHADALPIPMEGDGHSLNISNGLSC